MPNDKVSLSDGVHKGDINVSILLMIGIGPVLGALNLHLLHKVSEHHNSWNIVVPDHPPEVTKCVRKRALSCNVLFAMVITLHIPVTECIHIAETEIILKQIQKYSLGALCISFDAICVSMHCMQTEILYTKKRLHTIRPIMLTLQV